MDVSAHQLKLSRFWRKFLRLTRAGVSVLRTLQLIQEEEGDAAFKDVVGSMLHAIETGRTLSAACSEAPDYFSTSVIELVKTAERRGAWDEILEEIAEGLREGTFD